MASDINVKVLDLSIDMNGASLIIHPVLIWDGAGATLVDTCYPGLDEQLKLVVSQSGVPYSAIKRIIVTHQDWDHAGMVPSIQRERGDEVEVLAHRQETPYLEGKLPRLQKNPARKADYAVFTVNRVLEDGELLDLHGGIQVIHTPGHTPGHICLFVKNRRLLIAGDQLRVENGALLGPNPIYTPDMPAALAAMQKLPADAIDYVACFHGGLYGPDAGKSIRELAGL